MVNGNVSLLTVYSAYFKPSITTRSFKEMADSKKTSFFIFMFIVFAIFAVVLGCAYCVCALYKRLASKKLHPQEQDNNRQETRGEEN